MRTKDEILQETRASRHHVKDTLFEAAVIVECAKLEALLDIRDLIDDLAVAINEIDKTLCIVKK